MTPEERRALIEKPFFIRPLTTGYPWGGAHRPGLYENYILINGKRYNLGAEVGGLTVTNAIYTRFDLDLDLELLTEDELTCLAEED